MLKFEEITGKELTCVAVLYKEVIWVIGAPAEHDDVVKYIKHSLGESQLDGTHQFGFLTDKDEFISFNDGIKLAKAGGKFKE